MINDDDPKTAANSERSETVQTKKQQVITIFCSVNPQNSAQSVSDDEAGSGARAVISASKLSSVTWTTGRE